MELLEIQYLKLKNASAGLNISMDMTELIVSEFEDIPRECIQSTEERKKDFKKQNRVLRVKRSNIRLTRVPEGEKIRIKEDRENESEKLFEKMITKEFPKQVKDKNLQI